MSTPAVNVVVDGFAHLGPLSYLVPDGMPAHPGDAVRVPFGKREAHGLVIGRGSSTKATREILERYGARTTKKDLAAAELVATQQAVKLQQLTARLAPSSGKGAAPSDAGNSLALTFAPSFTDSRPGEVAQRRLLLRQPLVKAEELALAEAQKMQETGQVLILCPTTALVEKVLAKVTSGAVRLDAKAPRGDWAAFREGAAAVGVGTRAAAWYAPQKLAGIIVVEEQHEGHREQSAPRHHARDVALVRSQALGVPVVLISANPTPSAIGAGVQVHQVGLQDSDGWPIAVVHNEAADPVRSYDLPYSIIAELKVTAEQDTPLVVVGGKATRRCNSCFVERQPSHPLERCRECGEVGTRVVGYDKDRVNDLVPGAKPVLAHELSKHRDAGLVVVTEVSTLLARPELNPYHHATQVLVDAASAAGERGKVIAIVRDDSHPVLKLLLGNHDQLGIAQRAYNTAKRLHLPPFGKLATVQVLQKEPPALAGWPGHIHGPIETKGGWEFLVRFPESDMPAVQKELGKLRRKKVKLRYHID